MISLWKLPRKERSNVLNRVTALEQEINTLDRQIEHLQGWLKGVVKNRDNLKKEFDKLGETYNLVK